MNLQLKPKDAHSQPMKRNSTGPSMQNSSGLKPNSLTRGVIGDWRLVIGEGQTTARINHTPNFFHFNNQQSTINNHHSTIITRQSSIRWKKRSPVAYALMAVLVSPSGLEPNSQTAGSSRPRAAFIDVCGTLDYDFCEIHELGLRFCWHNEGNNGAVANS